MISQNDIDQYRGSLRDKGFAIVPGLYNDEVDELKELAGRFSSAYIESGANGVHAIRRFVHEVPGVWEKVWNSNMQSLVNSLFGSDYRLVKSIYFDKPKGSNWFVSYHQDLTISVKNRAPVRGYEHWVGKGDMFSVQPPLQLLEKNFTLRIHLDDTNEMNGALRVIPGSHKLGICRAGDPRLAVSGEEVCSVGEGGVMFMSPLLMHASSRVVSAQQRRVIHMEFSKEELPFPLEWAELIS